jgi:hypothetical protein
VLEAEVLRSEGQRWRDKCESAESGKAQQVAVLGAEVCAWQAKVESGRQRLSEEKEEAGELEAR